MSTGNEASGAPEAADAPSEVRFEFEDRTSRSLSSTSPHSGATLCLASYGATHDTCSWSNARSRASPGPMIIILPPPIYPPTRQPYLSRWSSSSGESITEGATNTCFAFVRWPQSTLRVGTASVAISAICKRRPDRRCSCERCTGPERRPKAGASSVPPGWPLKLPRWPLKLPRWLELTTKTLSTNRKRTNMREKKNSVPFMDADIATAPWGRKKLIVTKFSNRSWSSIEAGTFTLPLRD